MISDVEHLFLGLLASWLSPLGRKKKRTLGPIIHKVFWGFLVLGCTSMSYSLDINPLRCVSVAKHFCRSAGYLSFHWCFPLLDKSFSCQCALTRLCLLCFLLLGETYLENCSGCVQEITAYLYLSKLDGFRGHLGVFFHFGFVLAHGGRILSTVLLHAAVQLPHDEHAVFPPLSILVNFVLD